MRPVTRVGVRELRQNLSTYLRRVARGEAFEVTDRGTPVALLAPLAQRGDPLSRLVADGRAIPADADLLELGSPLRVRLEKPLSEVLDELRDEPR